MRPRSARGARTMPLRALLLLAAPCFATAAAMFAAAAGFSSPAPLAPPQALAQPACTASGPLTPLSRIRVDVPFRGGARSFLLVLPADGHHAPPPRPLLLVLHGAGDSAAAFLDAGAPLARAKRSAAGARARIVRSFCDAFLFFVSRSSAAASV
jgi:hypothetical protein